VYITDGHHTHNTFIELADGGPELDVFIRVTKNWKDKDTDEFWTLMQDSKFVWLRDSEDKEITPANLPTSLGLSKFQDDPFRTLVRLTKDMAYATDANTPPFIEFMWGSWLRRKGLDPSTFDLSDLAPAPVKLDENGKAVPDGGSATGYMALVRNATITMVNAADGEIIDAGFNATRLGKLGWPATAKVWNDFMEDEIWRSDLKSSGSPRKGGKMWYAKQYEKCGGAASTKPECWHGVQTGATSFTIV